MSFNREKDYNRVIPRDLFNEAKLLKCLGQLVLLIGKGQCPGLSVVQPVIDGSNAFRILQDQSDGSIYVSSRVLRFTRNSDKKMLRFVTPLNNKERWPLLLSPPDHSIDEIEVFSDTEDVRPTNAFLQYLRGDKQHGDSGDLSQVP